MTTNQMYLQGDLIVAGNDTAGFFIGDGSQLTNLSSTAISGTANYMPYFDGTGHLASEQFITSAQGGLGINTGASSGLAKWNAGVVTVATGQVVNADVAVGANIQTTKLLAPSVGKALVSDPTTGVVSTNSYQTIDTSGNIIIQQPINTTYKIFPSGTGYVNLGNLLYMDSSVVPDYYETFVKLTTANATPTSIYVVPFRASATTKISIELNAVNTTGLGYGSWAGYKLGFTNALIASTLNPLTNTGAGALNSYTSITQAPITTNPITFTFLSPNLTILVTGVAASTLLWTAKIKVMTS